MPHVSRRATLAGLLAAPAARAQPVPLRVIVPFAPGGATDVAARLIAPSLGEALGRPVVIENRGGGGTVIGTEATVNAAPDGNTLGFFTVSSAVLNALLRPGLRFETRRALAPVSLIGTMPMLVVAGPHVPAHTLGDLLTLLRESPRPLTYGSAGPGSINHLSAHLLAMRAGGRAEHVPYRGAGLVIPDLIAGTVDVLIEGFASLHPHVASGALRGLAVTGAARHPSLPAVQTAEEAGLPGYRILNWFGCFAPAATPAPAVARLAEGLRAAVRSPAVAQRLAENGIDAVGSDPEGLAQFWDAEFALWRPVVQAAGVTLD
ncbi:Bug family tripartite tricarboxylate transporter substrate binding protein [Siccirubricoccus phaeus]|uniref:Bug family tripartite tricarboxylate transporter substrate binding protein n=1 Tax=Siccirubricoccus phaeus TaxID=2595053 RepID=UPI0011F22571|nr:tripartite tricarboxylate transporter substrate-binding protein [Siccirubricoccus phaeus]